MLMEKRRGAAHLLICQTMQFFWALLFDFARMFCAYLILLIYFPCLHVLAWRLVPPMSFFFGAGHSFVCRSDMLWPGGWWLQ